MHLAFRKSLANGIVTVTSAGNWDELKAHLSELGQHDTQEWDAHRAWESFYQGNLIKDTVGIWRYLDLDTFDGDDFRDFILFEGRIIDLFEMNPLYS